MNGAESEWMVFMRAGTALVFVLALIYLAAALMKKYGLDKRIAGIQGKEKTLAVLETLYIDPRRKLVRVKAGNKEHLLLLAPTGDMLIASGDAEANL